MEKILKKYQERLNDISKRNRAIKLSRIVKKKTFDVASISIIDKERPVKLLNSIFIEGKSFNIANLNVKDKDEERVLKDILYLKRDVDFILKEKGYYECYLGYPFIQGNFFKEDAFFRAPLFLIPVQININRITQKIVIAPSENSEVIINKTFLLAFNKYNKDYKKIDIDNLENLDEIKKEDLIEWGVNIFNKLNMDVSLKKFKKDALEPLPVFKGVELPKDLVGKIEFLPHAIIGEFNQLNSALNNDYEDIIKNKKSNEMAEAVLGTESGKDLEERFDDEKLIDSSEKENYFITIPDISQEQVLINARMGKGIVIHGPPGTGKSQVITNLITDSLFRNKKILVVCEKRAALDVVRNRLASKGINKHCLLVHDSQNDRDKIFHQIETVLNEYDSNDEGHGKEELDQSESKMNEKAESFDAQLRTLKETIDIMHDKQKFGTSLYYLYRNSDKSHKVIIDVPDKTLEKISHKDLLSSTEKISKLSKNYYKFENKEHPFFGRKRLGNTFDDRKFKEEISKLLEITQSFEKIFYSREFKKDFELMNSSSKIEYDDLLVIHRELKEFRAKEDKKFSRLIDLTWWHLKSIYGDIRKKGDIDKSIKRFGLVQKSLEEISKSFRYLESLFKSNFIDLLKKNILNQKSNEKIIENIVKHFYELEEIIAFDSSLVLLNEFETNIAEQCYTKISSQSKSSEILWKEAILNNFYLAWIREIESSNSLLKNFSFETYEKARNQLQSLLKEKIETVPKVIYESFENKYKKLKWQDFDLDGRRKNYNHLKYLLHEVGKKRKKMTLREFFNKFQEEGLLELFPCWMCSPETVSSTFPMKKNIFDIVIFDEASQCKLERSIPSIIRAKKLIVAGDEKQLPPSDFFITSTEEDYEEIEDYGEKSVLENESLLERAKIILPGKRLIFHYRSNHEELINFSNYAFYDRNLRIVPKNEPTKEPCIEYKNVKGMWNENVNEKEAKEIVKYIKTLLKNKKNEQTIGVITFNKLQRDYIEELLDEESRNDLEFAKLFDKENNRYNNQEFIGLFVKNIENVQGDERDIIIFSVGYGFDKLGKFRYRFGPLNESYGPNRLNVAISRAKEKVIIFCSFEPSDFKYVGANKGPELLRDYLEYCKFVSESENESANKKLESLFKSEITYEEFDQYDSDFEGEVSEALVKLGYAVKTQVGCKGYKIDLAVLHPKDKKKFIVGIECDGAAYHSSKSAKDRDLYRQEILEGAGWKILRVWSRDWWNGQQIEIRRLDREIKKLL